MHCIRQKVGPDFFKIKHIKTIIIIIAAAICLISQISFANSEMVIPEVNLTLKKTTASNNTERIQTTTLTRDEIKDSPTTTLSDLLEQEQSIVRVINNSNDNSQLALSIRGFGDNAFANTLIVVDGFGLINPSILTPRFNALALSDIIRIKIIQGSQGSLWGNQAVGGVVDIETMRPKKFITHANTSYGSYNQLNYNMVLGNKLENGFFFKLVGFSNNTDNYRDHNHQTDEGASVQLGHDYATGSLLIDANIYDSTIELPGGLTKAQYDDDPRQASNETNFSHFRTYVYQLTHKQILSDDWLLETRLSHNKIDGDGVVGGAYTRKDGLTTINPLLKGSLFNSKTLIGYQWQTSNFELASSFTAQNVDAENNDIYAQIITPLSSKLDFTLGGRSSWQANTVSQSIDQLPTQTNDHVFVTEQGLAYRISDAWDVFIRRDGNFRFPKANELSTQPIDQTLLAQTGVSYEMGAKWQSQKHSFQLSGYQLKLDNEIAYDPTQTVIAPFGSFSNLSKTTRNGITLASTFQLSDTINIDGQVNYVDARFSSGPNEDNQIPAIPAINGNLGIGYQFKPYWKVKYIALYTGNRYPSQDVENTAEKLPAVWLNNISLQYLRESVNFSFEVENLFNKRYPTYTVYSPTTQANTYYPGAGRNFSITAKVFLN